MAQDEWLSLASEASYVQRTLPRTTLASASQAPTARVSAWWSDLPLLGTATAVEDSTQATLRASFTSLGPSTLTSTTSAAKESAATIVEGSSVVPSATSFPETQSIVESASFRISIAAAAAMAGLFLAIFVTWLVQRRRRNQTPPDGKRRSFLKRRSRPPSSIIYPEHARGCDRREEMIQSPNSYINNMTWSWYTPEDPYRIMQDLPVNQAAQAKLTRVAVVGTTSRESARRNCGMDDDRRQGRVGFWPVP